MGASPPGGAKKKASPSPQPLKLFANEPTPDPREPTSVSSHASMSLVFSPRDAAMAGAKGFFVTTMVTR